MLTAAKAEAQTPVVAVETLAGTPAPSTVKIEWYLTGSPSIGYSMSARGSATDTAGAQIMLQSTTEMVGEPYGAATAYINADSMRSKHVRVVADFDTRDVTGGATPWIRVYRDTVIIAMDNGASNAVTGSQKNAHREIALLIPASATRIVFGMLLSGTGNVFVTKLRLITDR